MRYRLVTWALLVSALALAVCFVEASGQTNSGVIYQYAVKVVQGKTAGLWGSPSPSEPLGEGLYCTSVNVHNPWADVAEYRFKLAVAGHFGDPGPITPFDDRKLDPDAVTQYDGEDFDFMLAAIGLPCPFCFFEGYFVIESRVELDVVAVYTGSVGNQALATMEMERVPAREIPIPCCGGLDLTISTGVAQWVVTQVPALSQQVPGPAQPAASSGWIQPSAGLSWVGFEPVPNADAIGDYEYQYTFCLCEGFTGVHLHFHLWADNYATAVLLNGFPITPTSSPSLSDCIQTAWFYGSTSGAVFDAQTGVGDPNDRFVVGQNTLTIRVYNCSSVSGILVSGAIGAIVGRCCLP